MIHLVNSESLFSGTSGKAMASLCGDEDPMSNVIPTEELAYESLEDIARMAGDEICEECANHPDLALFLLGRL